ncbi:hypothetical protein [Bradyrhizobium sp. STM 3557]|uniref:hypothetical protein n=1 Tax=Bradyrhizobium sp. STM 3557 TaxID=578920 RepID=UPI00388F6740
MSAGALDWLVLLRKLELLADELLLARGGGEPADGSAVAASTSAEKLLVYCEGSGRVDFGAVLWKAVLAWMSVETLNTLEPFAIEPSSPFSKERAKQLCAILSCKINTLRARARNFPDAGGPAISARPARFAALACGKRDCFAGSAPILKERFPVVSASAAIPLVWNRAKGFANA